MKYEPYADKGRPINYGMLEILLVGLLLVVLWNWKHTEHSWWKAFSPANQRVLQGICFEAVGSAFLWLRLKQRASLWPSSFWDFRSLLGTFGCLIAGIVCFVEAFQLR
jgi:hypothetical protein